MPMPRRPDLEAGSFALFFETNEDIDSGRLGRLISALSLEVDRYPAFRGEAKLTLRSAKSGSLLIEFVIVMAALASIGSFVHQITMAAKNSRQPKFCRRLAELMADDSVPHMEVAYTDENGRLVEMSVNRREMPAYHALLERRGAAAIRNPNTLTFGGEPVTFDGEPITTPPPRNRSDRDDQIRSVDEWPNGREAITTGRAYSARQGKPFKMSLAGEFERDPDGSYWFKSGGTVFEAEFLDGAMSHPPIGEPITVGAILDPSDPNKITISGSAISQARQ